MKRADLKTGDRVWVVLPYEGGRGWAEVISLHGTTKILVHFESGSTAANFDTDLGVRGRYVSPRSIVKKENA